MGKYSQAELRKKKALAEAILKRKGTDIDEMLGKMYDEIILENSDMLVQQLQTKPSQPFQGGQSNG